MTTLHMPTQNEAETVIVDPETALRWLEFNTGNRRLSMDNVDRLASDIKAGRWQFNGETIKFDREGRLIDGQHRLAAIVRAGVPLRLLVVRNLPPESQLTIDIGTQRRVSQQLRIIGMLNANEVAATAATLHRYLNHPDKIWSTANMPSKTEHIEFVQSHSDLLAHACSVAQRAHKATFIRRTSFGATFAAAHLAGWGQDFDSFAESFCSGANLAEGDSRLALRNTAMRYRRSHSTWDTQVLMACTLKAFNAYIQAKEVKLLRYTRDELPMPVIG